MILAERERRVLDFERDWPVHHRDENKCDAIRREFSVSPSRFYALLRDLTASPEARAYDPLLIARLARRADRTRRARFVSEPTRHRRPR